MLTMTKLRLLVQHLSFLILTYGSSAKIFLGYSIPCFSCPFVYTCSGHCYLMMLQRQFGSLFVPLVTAAPELAEEATARVLANLGNIATGFGIFALLVILLGKTWCGWICPFGLIQDWLTMLRQKLGIREAEMSETLKRRLSWIKYLLLGYLVLVPMLASARLISSEFVLAFCHICPGKSLMPLFNGLTRNLALEVSSPAAMALSLILLTVTGGMLVGMFVKERFFCLFCPMLALMNLLKRFHLLRLVKEPHACRGCGNCRRSCFSDIETVYRQKTDCDVYDPDCMACFKCAEHCDADTALKVKFGPFTLFSSARRYAARLKK